MKKRNQWSILFLVVLVALMSVCVSAQDPADGVILAKAVYGTPEAIDAVLDAGWDGANTYVNEGYLGVEENETDISATWKVMYDNAYLYFFVQVQDETLGDADYEYAADGGYWGKNAVHLMFDLGYERGTGYDANDFYIDISCQGYYNNHSSKAYDYVTYETALTDGGYCIEVRVDFDYCEGFAAAEGTCIGFDLWANDNIPPLSGRMCSRTWSDSSDSSWWNPSTMGTIQFEAIPDGAKTVEKVAIVAPQYKNIADDMLPTLCPGTELKALGAVYTGITNAEAPQGGGSKDIAVIVDGDRFGDDGGLQYDSWGATFADEGEYQWFGAEFDQNYVVSSVVFCEGGQWGDGGWFGSTPFVQLKVNGEWVDTAFTLYPDYPGDSFDEQAPAHEAYFFTLAEATECSAVRVLGGFNGLAGHASCAEIEAYGYAVGGEAAVEEAPAEEAPIEVAPVEVAPAEEVVEVAAPVEEVVEAPVVVSAPQTFDAAIIAAVAAVVSLAGYAVSKKH